MQFTIEKHKATSFSGESATLTTGIFPDEMQVRIKGGTCPTLSTTGFGEITPENAVIYAELLVEAAKIAPTLSGVKRSA